MSMTSAGPKRRYLRAQRVFTATGKAPIEDGVVVIDGSVISQVARASEIKEQVPMAYPTGTILPGLVDAHCHLTLPADRRTYEQMILDPDEMLSLIAVRNLRTHLASGVTTLRDNGGRNRVTFVVREAVQRGYIDAPRMLLSGRPVTHRYGHFYWCNGVADGEDELRATVRQLVAEGADHIKIMASGGATAGNIPYFASYTAEELGVIVDAAHALGRLTTAHCRARQSMLNAVQAGLDCIEHAEFLVPGAMVGYEGLAAHGKVEYDGRVTDSILESGAYISYTFQAGGYDTLVELTEKARSGKLSDEEIAVRSALDAYFDEKITVFRNLIRDGMQPKLVLSTDAGPFDTEFGRMHYGMDLAVASGMKPADAIEASTRIAAAACGVDHLAGTLERGKQADLLVVDGNPIQDITCMRRPLAVFSAGKQVAGDPLRVAAT
jgi:imidazolonepropionase-like amidohydrolase